MTAIADVAAPCHDVVQVMPREIRLNAFDMNCVGHIQHGMWAHPRDRSMHYTDLDHWVSLARTLERGLFDGLFLADILGVYDVFHDSPDASIRNAVQIPVNDPLLLVPAMAYATQHLGFGVTCNLTYEPPYTFARRMSTLDHLTKGRIGWNVVTGYLDSAARGMGLAQQPEHDSRYDVAEEYMQVVYQLWEGSWEDARRAARPRGPDIRRSGAHPSREARRPALQGRCHPSVRTIAPAHARAVPGRRLGTRARIRRRPRRVHLRQRPVSSQRARNRGRHPRAGQGDRPRPVRHQGVRRRHRGGRADRRGGTGQARGVSRVRQFGRRAGALLGFGRRRFLALRSGRADPLRQHQRDALQPGGHHGAQPRHRMDAAQAAGDDGAGQPPGTDRRLAVARRGRVAGMGGRGGRGRLQSVAHGHPRMRGGLRGTGGAGIAGARGDEAGICGRHAAPETVRRVRRGCRRATRPLVADGEFSSPACELVHSMRPDGRA